MNYTALEIQINNLIARNEIREAIELLTKYFHGDERLRDIVLQSAQFHALTNDQINGVINYETVQRNFNRLRANILDYVALVKEAGVEMLEEEVNVSTHYWSSAARTMVLAILFQQSEGGLSIRDIYEISGIENRRYIAGAVREMEKDGLLTRQKIDGKNFFELSESGNKMAVKLDRSLRLLFSKA